MGVLGLYNVGLGFMCLERFLAAVLGILYIAFFFGWEYGHHIIWEGVKNYKQRQCEYGVNTGEDYYIHSHIGEVLGNKQVLVK